MPQPEPCGELAYDQARDHDQRYDLLISASSREAAVAIAAEALPAGCAIQSVEASDVAAREGRDSWHVAVWFTRVERVSDETRRYR